MRRPNWDIHLAQWAQSVAGSEFEWGVTDCGTLVREALAVLYEKPPIHEVPKYTSLREAKKVFEDLGGVEGVLRAGGAEKVDFNFVRQGDVIIGDPWPMELPGAAVVVDVHGLVSSVDDGVLLRPLRLFSSDVTVLRLP